MDAGEKLGANLAEQMPQPDIDDRPRDRFGRTFDPNLHSVDRATGGPKLTASGKLRARRGTSSSNFNSDSDSSDVNEFEAFGKVMAENNAILLGAFLPPVAVAAEKAALAQAWSSVGAQYGVDRIPPWMQLLLAHTAIILPRLQTPENTSRIRQWIMRMRNRRNARFDSRDNGMRENYARDTNE